MPPPTFKIAVIGDLHEQWEPLDNLLLQGLGVDLALFVGDFGNESVPMVQRLSQLALPKAFIFGNHDAWYSASEWGRGRCPYDRSQEDRLQQQIELLGELEVGYRRLDFPALGLSVVGSRPFSWGGREWKNAEFYRDRYGITNFQESCDRIVAAGMASPQETLVLLGHNGPLGLGSEPEAPCGKDWVGKEGGRIGGDYGDPDFAEAIAQLQIQGKRIPLVCFGHMHHGLRHRRDRLRTCVVRRGDTLYLNAARLPRMLEQSEGRIHWFLRVTLQEDREGHRVTGVEGVWLSEMGWVMAAETLA